MVKQQRQRAEDHFAAANVVLTATTGGFVGSLLLFCFAGLLFLQVPLKFFMFIFLLPFSHIFTEINKKQQQKNNIQNKFVQQRVMTER